MLEQPQLWHRDMPVPLQTVGVEHAFSCFMLVNLDCPMDGRENMFVYASGFGVPYPLHEVAMSMLAGNLWILSSCVIHRGGAVPIDALLGSTRILPFAAIVTSRVDYQTTVTIIPPPWAEAPAPQPSPPSPKAVHCAAAQCNRAVKPDPPAKCFACDERPLCALHLGQLCADCQRDSGEDVPAVEAARGPAMEAVEMAAEGAEEVHEGTQKIVEEDLSGFAGLLMIPLDETVLYTPIAQGHWRQRFLRVR